jgi:hypothetical protein
MGIHMLFNVSGQICRMRVCTVALLQLPLPPLPLQLPLPLSTQALKQAQNQALKHHQKQQQCKSYLNFIFCTDTKISNI